MYLTAVEEEITDLDIQADRTAHGTMETTRGREDTDEDRIGPAIVLEVGQETDLGATQAERAAPWIDPRTAL